MTFEIILAEFLCYNIGQQAIAKNTNTDVSAEPVLAQNLRNGGSQTMTIAVGNGFEENFEDLTLRQLRKIASKLGISRYSRMRKEQLLAEVKRLSRANPSSAKAPVAATALESRTPVNNQEEETQVEAAKFEVGQDDPIELDLADVDADLGDLPGGYGQSRIVLLPRDPQWAYAYWDIPNDHKQYLRNQGGQQIALRLYDVTDINLDYQTPHNVQEYLCDGTDWTHFSQCGHISLASVFDCTGHF